MRLMKKSVIFGIGALLGCSSVEFQGDEQIAVGEIAGVTKVGQTNIEERLNDGVLVIQWIPIDDDWYFSFENELSIYRPRNPSLGSRCIGQATMVGSELGLFPTQRRDFIFDADATIDDGIVALEMLGKGYLRSYTLGLLMDTMTLDTNVRNRGGFFFIVGVYLGDRNDGIICAIDTMFEEGLSWAEECYFESGAPDWIDD